MWFCLSLQIYNLTILAPSLDCMWSDFIPGQQYYLTFFRSDFVSLYYLLLTLVDLFLSPKTERI